LQFRHRPHDFVPRIIEPALQLVHLCFLLQHFELEARRALLQYRVAHDRRPGAASRARYRAARAPAVCWRDDAAYRPRRAAQPSEGRGAWATKLHRDVHSFNRVTLD